MKSHQCFCVQISNWYQSFQSVVVFSGQPSFHPFRCMAQKHATSCPTWREKWGWMGEENYCRTQ
jgi:hypothetical protein